MAPANTSSGTSMAGSTFGVMPRARSARIQPLASATHNDSSTIPAPSQVPTRLQAGTSCGARPLTRYQQGRHSRPSSTSSGIAKHSAHRSEACPVTAMTPASSAPKITHSSR